MISAEDLFTDEAADDLERIIEGDEDEDVVELGNENVENTNEGNADEGNNDEGNNDDNQEDKEKKKKRVLRNPQPKLDAEALKKPRGLLGLESLFDRVKFKGRGQEEHDLNVMMKTYEYWCHRLFPKFPFDDCIARLEKLGNQKPVRTYLKRIRQDMLTDSDERPEILNDDVGGMVEDTSTMDDQFDSLISQPPMSSTESAPVEVEPLEWTDEQLRRMQENKERAQRKKLERLRQIQEKAASVMERSQNKESSPRREDISTQSSVLNGIDNEETNNLQSSKHSLPNQENFENRNLETVDIQISEESIDKKEAFTKDISHLQDGEASTEIYIPKSMETSDCPLINNQETTAQDTCDNQMEVDEIENTEQLEQVSNVESNEDNEINKVDKYPEETTLQMEEYDDSTEIYHGLNVAEPLSDDLSSHDKEQD